MVEELTRQKAILYSSMANQQEVIKIRDKTITELQVELRNIKISENKWKEKATEVSGITDQIENQYKTIRARDKTIRGLQEEIEGLKASKKKWKRKFTEVSETSDPVANQNDKTVKELQEEIEKLKESKRKWRQKAIEVSETTNPMANNGARWKSSEIEKLKEERSQNIPLEEIAKLHARSVRAIEMRLQEIDEDEKSPRTMKCARWTTEEVEQLVAEREEGLGMDEIASRHGRTRNAIVLRIKAIDTATKE